MAELGHPECRVPLYTKQMQQQSAVAMRPFAAYPLYCALEGLWTLLQRCGQVLPKGKSISACAEEVIH